MKKSLFSSAFFTIVFHFFGYAQENDHNGISLDYFQGLKTFSTYTTPLVGMVHGADLRFLINTQHNDADWVDALRVQNIYVEGSYANEQNISFYKTPNTHVFGTSYGVATGLDLRLLQLGPLELMASPGLGLAYDSKDFYTTRNVNYIDGSRINLLLEAEVKVLINLVSGVTLEAGFKDIHTSDSGGSMPNCGFNAYGAFVGLKRDLEVSGPDHYVQIVDPDDENSFEIGAAIGPRGQIKTGYYADKQNGKAIFADTVAVQAKTPAIYQGNVYIGYNRRLNSLFILKIGIDGTYYFQTFQWDRFLKTYEGVFTSYGHVNLGISAGGGICLGKLIISANYGRYVYDKFLYPTTKSYIVVGAEYPVTSWLSATIKITAGQYASAGFNVYVK
jgi:hypothetical protein